MPAKRKNYIILTTEGVSAGEIADSQVSKILGGAQIADSVSTMSGADIPSEDTILANEDFGIITANLTAKEAESLLRKKGIHACEEDEEVFASSINTDASGNSGSLDDVISADPAATEEIDASTNLEDALLLSDEQAAEQAKTASETAFEIADDIDFDEQGNAFSLSGAEDAMVVSEFSNLGVPREKIAKLLKCILKCAAKELSDGSATEISQSQIENLLAAQGVVGPAESIQAVRDYITCGLRIIYANFAWRYTRGAGSRVAVIDTGIDRNHRDLTVFGGVSFVPGVASWNDDNGHGTHVAGTIAAIANNHGLIGVAPSSKLYAVKVLSASGSGSTSSVLNGLAWCYRTRMHIANLSLGGLATTHSTGTFSAAYERAGRTLRSRGILAVAAAGNSGSPGNRHPYVGNPARCPSFMAVSAVDCARRRARFSSYGPQVEITAPGVNVWSTTYSPFAPFSSYGAKSGTSMACPHVAGVAALVKSRHPGWHGDSIRLKMRGTARDLGSAGHDWFYGYCLVNAYRSVR